ncbi:MAG: hypothetical protein MRECE_27c007 [Mycoplasmataceae bacterium CE_OT135]|nr:MAG: hypothetical protein MRECE_27c007 [Mycoplasmataceae bacterium CE_OT135]
MSKPRERERERESNQPTARKIERRVKTSYMTNNITVKIKKFMSTLEEDGKTSALYEVEPFNYGDHSYSQIEIEYQNKSDLSEFAEGKSIKIEVGEDMTVGEGTTLTIKGGTWNADRTIWQKIKDKSKETKDKIGDASSDAVNKTGEGLKKAGENLEKSSNEDKWPRWVLPVAIGVGLIALIGIVVWIFKPSKR